jgi:hypothetical protein
VSSRRATPASPVARSVVGRVVVLACVSCLVLGGGAGFWVARTSAAPRPVVSAPPKTASDAPGEARSVVVAGSTTAHLGEDDRAALRTLIREEVAAALPHEDARRAARDPQPAEVGAAALSDAQLKAYDQARAAIDDGIARGTWTPENRVQLRATLAGLPAETAVEVLRPLILAVNERKVHWEGRGPLM